MIKIGQLECTNIKWGSSCPKLWQTFEGLTKISLMKHHPCNKTSWDVCVCVCVWPILCLVFKRFRAHMNWIQWSQQMNVDKILCLRKEKSCQTTSLLLGKNKIKTILHKIISSFIFYPIFYSLFYPPPPSPLFLSSPTSPSLTYHFLFELKWLPSISFGH
jgi:hypothetical protein